MKTNTRNQLVLRGTPSAEDAAARKSNMICIRGDLRVPIELLRVRTEMTNREIVNTLLEYALNNVQLVEEE